MKLRIILAFIALAAMSRLLPHPPNFTPIAAMGLFGAAYFDKKWLAFVAPFVGLFVSDLILNNIFLAEYYEGFVWMTSPWIYVAFGLVIAFGAGFFKKITVSSVAAASLMSAAIFFLITNGVWMPFNVFPKTIDGQLASYVAGLPFLGNTILGNLVFSAVLFGGYALLEQRLPSLQKTT